MSQPTLWSAPQPASDEELQRHELPCDVQVGNTIFRRGTSLYHLVAQHRAFYQQVVAKAEGNLL